MHVTDDMVNRFLSWQIPSDFRPDGGIVFDGRRPGPAGTNLLTATQARQMLHHVITDMTPEEADKAYDDSPEIPISDEECERLVNGVMVGVEPPGTDCGHDERFRGVIGCRNGCLACELEATKADADRWRYVRDNHAQGSSPTMDGNMAWRFTQLRWCVGRSPDEVVDKLIRKEYEA